MSLLLLNTLPPLYISALWFPSLLWSEISQKMRGLNCVVVYFLVNGELGSAGWTVASPACWNSLSFAVSTLITFQYLVRRGWIHLNPIPITKALILNIGRIPSPLRASSIVNPTSCLITCPGIPPHPFYCTGSLSHILSQYFVKRIVLLSVIVSHNLFDDYCSFTFGAASWRSLVMAVVLIHRGTCFVSAVLSVFVRWQGGGWWLARALLSVKFGLKK